jgi:hypothetical protein
VFFCSAYSNWINWIMHTLWNCRSPWPWKCKKAHWVRQNPFLLTPFTSVFTVPAFCTQRSCLCRRRYSCFSTLQLCRHHRILRRRYHAIKGGVFVVVYVLRSQLKIWDMFIVRDLKLIFSFPLSNLPPLNWSND